MESVVSRPQQEGHGSDCGQSVGEIRMAMEQYGTSIARIDKEITTVKRELMLLRQQDLHLVKQFIQIHDSIRRLARSRDRHGGKRLTYSAAKELMTSATNLSQTLGRLKAVTCDDYNPVRLVRRQSEPHMCMLGLPVDASDDARSWGSRRGSASSSDLWFEDTLETSQDFIDIRASDDDLDSTVTVIDTTDTKTDITSSGADKLAESVKLMPDYLHRPKSHSVVASNFLGRSNLSGGHSNYSDILSQNVKLWKDRLEHAESVRQRVLILEEES